MSQKFILPDLGDNVSGGTVVSVMVSEGDSISEEQTVIELETDKAVIEVPATFGGVVKKILVKKGDDVKVGQVIFEFTENGAKESPQPTDKPEKAKAEPQQSEPPKQETETKISSTAEEKISSGPVEFKVPFLGDNIESGTVATILVKAGDSIEKEQGIVELETDKAVIEIPSDIVGPIKEVLVKEGDVVKVGQKILVVDAIAPATEKPKPAPVSQPETGQTPEPIKPQTVIAQQVIEDEKSSIVLAPVRDKSQIAPASPSTRRFAREIGVDIHEIPGSGPGGRISIDDVKAYSKMVHKQRALGGGAGISAEPLPDFSKLGPVEVQDMSKLRETAAKHLSYAWMSIPHVTQFDKADITELEKIRKANGKKAEAAGGKLTMTAILIKVIEAALRKFPQFNASVDMTKNQIIFKKYFNIGIAADTDRGLVVPVIRNVDKKNIIQLSVELTELSKKARDRKLTLEEMQGSNFTISNLGGIGGTAFTPIVNSPDVAILGVSRSEMEPKFIDGEFKPRLMLPLSLSYDHKLVDGADAARFLRWVCEVLEQPFNVLLEG